MQPLDPLTLPLHGCRLLEASAGTGKTYTLALLFLRLLLERGLAVDQILVVTFTRAATGELRDRIRRRLREALDALDHRIEPDDQLATLLAAIPPEDARQRLADALVRMDEAAIHTIHGFCQRILQDHAFESGTPFALELLESEAALRREVIEDFWRNRFYPASEEETAWAAATWGEPAGLLKALGPALTAMACDLIPRVDVREIDALADQCRRLFAEVQQAWPQDREAVGNLLDQDPCLQRSDKTYRRSDRVPELLDAMDQLTARPAMPLLLAKELEKLTASTMAGSVLKKCASPPQHAFFILFDAFWQSHGHLLRSLTIQVLLDARNSLRRELDARKQARGRLAFDDLLIHLDAALARSGSGPQLAGRIAARYPVALVDEFQDTDPVQYQVFSHIYRNGRQDGGALFMIGDPKQAIYSFRGADIFTYIQARRATPTESRYTMGVNYRSTPAMVAAVNTVFGRRRDAFVFAEDIDFAPVRAAAADAGALTADERPLAPLTGLLLDAEQLRNDKSPFISKERATRAAVAFTADVIVELLEQSAQGRATIAGRPLQTSDIAILVRSHREAEAMQAGLRRRRLNSVSASQSSVFASAEAGHLALALAALVDLADPARIRACLATPLFGCSGETIHALASNEQAWETRMAGLLRCQQLWRDQGFMPMFQHLLAEEQVARRLSALAGGERSLTNFLHLAELLQQSPAGQHSTAALLRWFRQQIDNPDANAANQLIRLENDEQLIRIVTIHRAKGLEFPVVFLPFLWAGRTLAKDQPLSFHDCDTLRLTLDLGSGEAAHRQQAEKEQLAEDLRLLYVAVTRAKCACFFCWGRVKGLEQTALAHLVHQGRCPEDDGALIAELRGLNAAEPILALRTYPQTFGGGRLEPAADQAGLQAKIFRGRITPGWTMTSYSRLSAGGETPQDGDQGESNAAAPEDFTSLFTFPRGRIAGSCLHGLLERLDFNRPAGQQQRLVAEALEQASIDPRWQAATVRWLDDLLAVELPGACALNAVAAQDRINELSFLFPLEQVDLRRFNGLLEGAGFRPLTAPGAVLQGLMKGFIDLVFRRQGRYCIVDYKSNHLGPTLAHYTPEAIAACMDSHQYHLQSLIYTLALHRYLRSRIARYHYDDHVGSAYYLFLRAMHPAHPPGAGIHVSRPDFSLIAALDDCCQGGRS